MRQITIASIARSTSALGFGTGGLLRIHSARKRLRTLEAAFEMGITHFDTAPIYGLGESERTLGRFLQGRRANITLATKFGLRPSALAARLAGLQGLARRALTLLPSARRVAARNTSVLYAQPNFSPRVVQATLEASLRALRTDYVDCYLAHEISLQSIPDAALIELLDKLRREGKIRSYGIATGFANVGPVLQQRPELSGVIQFDSDVSRGNVSGVAPAADRLLITFGSLQRSIALCRRQLHSCSGSGQVETVRLPADLQDLERLDDDALGGILLRAAVLSNVNGIVLMQSRHISRIERNVRAADDASADEYARALARLAGARL